MTKKKRHHYIPRFYLKRFSINSDGKFLGLYNLKNEMFIQKAPLKNQAYENYLYGEDDEVEEALANMEGNIAKMFYHWTEEKILYPPPTDSNGFKLLSRFILYQTFRTPKSGVDIMDAINQGFKAIAKEFEPQFSECLEDGTLIHENPVLLGLLNSVKYEYLLNFLDCKFLVNLSLLPFITSDAPVIPYNHLMERANNYVGATGLVAKGLQIFYPIHPRLMICLYDPEVYEFGNGCVNCTSTESIEEVNQLNGLQLINCKSQIFFNDCVSEEDIKDLCERYRKYRGRSRKINDIIHQGDRKFFLISSENVQTDLRLNFFKLKVNPNDFKSGIVPLRHISLERR